MQIVNEELTETRKSILRSFERTVIRAALHEYIRINL
jgi:hypothetical protein